MIKPTLALIPSGVGVDKLYSVLPSDGTGDFTFDRNLNTATRINKDGLIEMVDADVPRLNYPLIDGIVSGCPSLLLEPASTNLVTYSENFSQGWSNTNSTITINQNISPSGEMDADKFISDNTIQPRVEMGFTVPVTNTIYTFSVFVKKINTRYIALSRFSGGQGAIFDLDTKSVASSSAENASIKEIGNDWFRISITQTVPSTDSFNVWKINGTNGTSIDIGIVGDETFIWGAMLEQGSFPTSYIPTSGGTATRSAETCNNAGDVNTFNDSEGVLMAEISALADDGTYRILSLSNGTRAERIYMQYTNSSNELSVVVKNGSVTQANIGLILTNETEFNKILFKYKANDFALWVNGFEVGTDTIGNTPTGLSELAFDDGNGNNDFYGNVKEIKYFNKALSDAELQALTKI